MFVSVVIPTLNRRETLEFVLPSLANQSVRKDSYEILLCDNHSDDGTEEFVQELAIQNLRYIRTKATSRGGCRNEGIRAARGKIILFTDADIIAKEDLLERHLEFHERFRKCAVVGCEVQVDSLEEYESLRKRPEIRSRLHPPWRKRLTWLFFLTGNASVPKSILEEVGLFDEDFTGYGHEDHELGYRIQKRGIPILYNPKAINFHLHPVSFEERCRKMHLAGISAKRFFNKHKDWRIRYRLGMNPIFLLLHPLIRPKGMIIRFLYQINKKIADELILQYHYLAGIKEGI